MKKLFLTLVLAFTTSATLQSQQPSPHRYGYIGSKKCMRCHPRQYKSWKETRMAQAFEILKPGQRAEAKQKAGLDPNKDYTQDEKCVACHTTGYGKPGGFVDARSTPDLLGVGCEMCHGAGGEYTKNEYMSLKNKKYKLSKVIKVGLVSPVTGETCTTLCHNEKSPFFAQNTPFNFEERKTKGTHIHLPLKYKHN